MRGGGARWGAHWSRGTGRGAEVCVGKRGGWRKRLSVDSGGENVIWRGTGFFSCDVKEMALYSAHVIRGRSISSSC